MRITPLEIRNHGLRKGLRGYDVREVEDLRDLAAQALEEAAREIMDLREKLGESSERIREYAASEGMLKQTITTAQRMVEDLKENAKKEAELILVEARLQAEEIIRQSQGRAAQLQDEIFRLRKQRKELEASLKAVLDYHNTTLLLEEEAATRADEEAGKLKFISK